MNLQIERTPRRLRRELAAWQRGAIGLLALSAATNFAICGLYAAERSKAEKAEAVRDQAVSEYAALALQAAQESEAREVQKAAYEALEGYRYIGECTVTYYCCEAYKHICGTGDGVTATGLPVEPGMVAVDPEVIPLGSQVIIDGTSYLAADTGVQGLHIDVAVPSHAEALEMGVRTADVWIVPTK